MHILKNDFVKHTCGENYIVCFSSSTTIDKDTKKACLDFGIARKFNRLFKGLDFKLGTSITNYGNRCFNLGTHLYDFNITTVVNFPTRLNYSDTMYDLDIIRTSCVEILQMSNAMHWKKIYIHILALKNIDDVINMLAKLLDNRFYLILNKKS